MRICCLILIFFSIAFSQQTTNRIGSFDSLKSNVDTLRVIDTVRFYRSVVFDVDASLKPSVLFRSSTDTLGTKAYARSLVPSNFVNVYNVKNYGALGDSATDDYYAIKATFAAATAAGGGTVYFPKGTYKTSGGFSLGQNINIIGDGRENSIIASYAYGAGESLGNIDNSSTVFFTFTDGGNNIIEDIWVRGASIDGGSSQGFRWQLSSKSNVADVIMSNVLVSDMSSNDAIYLDTPILSTFTNVKVLRHAGVGIRMYNGTSVTMNECYVITCTEQGFYFDTMTYCTFNSCATEVCGVGYYFKSSSAIVMNGCGEEGSYNRNDARDKYAYGSGVGSFKIAAEGIAYKSVNSHIQLNSCYSRDPFAKITDGNFDKINMREFVLYPLAPLIRYDTTVQATYAGSNTTIASAIDDLEENITLAAGTGSYFPSGGFWISIFPVQYATSEGAYESSQSTYSGNQEIMYVNSRSGDVLSVTRGINDRAHLFQTARIHAAGSKVTQVPIYKYAVSFYYGGEESGLSGYVSRYRSTARMRLIDIPTSTNTITGRKIWRTKGDGQQFYLIATIADNVTTTFTDSIPDAGLVAPVAPEPTPHQYWIPTAGGTTMIVNNNVFIVGDTVRVDYSDDIPQPLRTYNTYFVKTVSGNNITISTTVGGSALAFSDTGSGLSNTITNNRFHYQDLGIENNFVTNFTNTYPKANGDSLATMTSLGVKLDTSAAKLLYQPLEDQRLSTTNSPTFVRGVFGREGWSSVYVSTTDQSAAQYGGNWSGSNFWGVGGKNVSGSQRVNFGLTTSALGVYTGANVNIKVDTAFLSKISDDAGRTFSLGGTSGTLLVNADSTSIRAYSNALYGRLGSSNYWTNSNLFTQAINYFNGANSSFLSGNPSAGADQIFYLPNPSQNDSTWTLLYGEDTTRFRSRSDSLYGRKSNTNIWSGTNYYSIAPYTDTVKSGSTFHLRLGDYDGIGTGTALDIDADVGQFRFLSGPIVEGIWNATSIDTAYTNSVSKLTAGVGATVTKYAKDYQIKLDTNALRSIYVPYNGATGAVNLGAQTFTTTGAGSFGALNGSGTLTITGTGAHSIATAGSGITFFRDGGGQFTGFHTYGNVNGSSIVGQAYAGTKASPTQIATSQILANFRGNGYINGSTRNQGNIQHIAKSTPSSTNYGSYTRFQNVPDSSTTQTTQAILDWENLTTPRFTLGTVAGTGTGSLYVGTISSGAITSSGFIDGTSAITDTSAFTTTATRKAVYISGAVSADKYVVTWRNLAGDEATIPTEVPFYYAKTDSLIVMRSAGTTSGLKFSYIRIK